MKPRKLRHLAFQLHRYLGLGVGLILVIMGLTGSLLVFVPELDAQIVQQRFGYVMPQAQPIAPDKLVETVKIAYANHSDWKINQVQMVSNRPYYTVRLKRPDETQWKVFVNPYTGKVMGDRILNSFTLLHYGTFGGLPTRILYIFVGLAPMVLLVTDFVMWHYRQSGNKTVLSRASSQPILARRE
jgi:uncharacterized iron-regulated membrane protein